MEERNAEVVSLEAEREKQWDAAVLKLAVDIGAEPDTVKRIMGQLRERAGAKARIIIVGAYRGTSTAQLLQVLRTEPSVLLLPPESPRSSSVVTGMDFRLPDPTEPSFFPERPWRPGEPRLPAFLRRYNERHPDSHPGLRGRVLLPRNSRRGKARCREARRQNK